MSSDFGDDSFPQFVDQWIPADMNKLNDSVDDIMHGDSNLTAPNGRRASDSSDQAENITRMLRESKLKNHRVCENEERTTSSSDEMAQDVWQKYRPKAAINFSDLVEEHTMDVGTASPSSMSPYLAKFAFEPNEITGRSTTCLPDNGARNAGAAADMSIDMILSDSFVHKIRNMSTNIDDADDKLSRNSLPANNMTNNSFPNSTELPWNRSCYDPPKLAAVSVSSEDFAPYEQMQDKLWQDEREWQNEFGILPSGIDRYGKMLTSTAKVSNAESKNGGKLVNLTEFSGYLAGNNTANCSTMSLGQYFSKRCEDIREIIPSKSPTKTIPIALLGDSYRSGSEYNSSCGSKKYSQVSTSFYTDDELKIKSLPRATNATYDKKTIMSVSSIAAKLGDDSQESPATFVTKFSNSLRAMAAKSATNTSVSSSSAVEKLSEIEKNENASKSAFTTANTSIGMLAQMNSTRIDDDKENKPAHHQNSSADTESASHFNGDFTSAASGYESSFQELSPHKPSAQKQNLLRLSPKRLGYDEQRPTSSFKRMRSPPPTTSAHLPDIYRNPFPAPSPKKLSPKKTNEENHRLIDYQTEMQIDGERRFVVTPRSPMDGSKFSLPNYGLRNNVARGLSQSPTAVPVARSSSQCSTNSEFSQNDGKFPLKANKNQLTWECVKLQKSIARSFVVKNTAHKRLTVKMHVTGPGFQIASASQDQGPLVLLGNECRTISVIFCPTVIGKAIGKVTFKPSKGWPDETERSIHLYGYGGHTTLQLQNIERGPVGMSFLKMGETSSIRSTTLQRVFFIYNKGPLNGMATISVKPKTNQYIHETHIQIEPSKCVIKADSSVRVTVAYKLRRKDLEKLSQKSCEVLTIATLEVIIGADPNRQRIATILTRTGTIPTAYRSLEFLVKDFPNENAEEFNDFGENLDNIADLFNCFKTSDIALTINRTTLDETRDTCTDLSGIEDSLFFRTLADERADAECRPHRMHHETAQESWWVYPSRLVMDQMDNNRKQLTIRNDFNKAQTFQVETNFRQLFTFSPVSGLVNPGNECKIDVQLKTNIHVPSDVKISILIESDSIEIPVTVRPAPPPYMHLK